MGAIEHRYGTPSVLAYRIKHCMERPGHCLFLCLALGVEPQGPLGDPIPLSIYLIARLANDTGYHTQFNLDSDRAYGYLTWDWIRDQEDRAENDALGLDYAAPNEWPLLSEDWDGPGAQMQLEYVDPATEEEPG